MVEFHSGLSRRWFRALREPNDRSDHGRIPPERPCGSLSGLLLVALDEFARNSHEVSEQPTGTVIGAGSEVHLCRWRIIGITIARADVSWTDGPNAVNRQGFSAGILQQSFKSPGCQIVRGDEAAGLRGSASRELPHKQIVTESPEIEAFVLRYCARRGCRTTSSNCG
jgi:hypothetical protein